MCCPVIINGYLVCCVSDRVCELFGETIRNILLAWLLDSIEVLSVGGCALLDRPCIVFQRVSVVCW